MKIDADEKLSIIAEAWNSYFLQYRFCQSKIKYTRDVQSNYLGDILRYFNDTFPMLYSKSKVQSFTRNMERAISFLQIVYTQQDMVEELLHIFRCDEVIGKLKKDANYSTNRIIRNELIGHPIRKKVFEGTNELLSSTIFSNSLSSDNIAYILYHRDNDYRFAHKTVSRSDILQRHTEFLKHYFDIIINKVKLVLKRFSGRLVEIKKAIKIVPFENLIKLVGSNFEYIYETHHLYRQEILLNAYKLKHTHERYSLAVTTFLADLDAYLEETITEISHIGKENKKPKVKRIKVKYAFSDEETSLPKKRPARAFNYELSKLAEKNKLHNFEFAASLLRAECSDNTIVLAELNNMENNLDNDFEYYCSYNLIKSILKE